MGSIERGNVTVDRSVFRYWLGALVVLVIVVGGSDGYSTKVMTKFGQIRGLWSRSSRGRLVAHYLGIPYAEPPVGDLRFRSPQPWNRTWSDTYDATENSPMCVQLEKGGTTIGSEDCLYLNIFVPMVSENRGGNSGLPVMVYVHGGAYNSGSGDSRKLPPDYLMDQDVILVTINYRLNILGFFSTGSKASPGNYGLKDAVLALRWVNENIESFNGDRNAITLWGHSAGAAVVHTLALSDKTDGLFNRYILQSGNAFCPWALNSRKWMRKMAFKTARLVGCVPERGTLDGATDGHVLEHVTSMQPELTTQRQDDDLDEENYDEEQEEEMMSCLRNVEAWRIVETTDYYEVGKGDPCCIFAPTIEEQSKDAIVTMQPLAAIKNRLFRDVPFIMGVVENEGLAKTAAMLSDVEAQHELINNFETYLPYLSEYYQRISNTTAFSDAIEEFYFDGNVSLTLKRNITEVISDSLFLWPTYQTLKYQSDVMNSSTYFYLFSYEGTFTSTFSTGLPTHYGISHTDDLNYIIPLLNKKHEDQMLHNTESDVTMINIMTEMWANFATEGVPKAWRMPAWPNYKDSHEFLRFGIGRHPEVITDNEFFSERMNFWDDLAINLTLNTIEPDTIMAPLIKDEEQVSNSSISNKYNEILACLLIIFAIYTS